MALANVLRPVQAGQIGPGLYGQIVHLAATTRTTSYQTGSLAPSSIWKNSK